MQRGVSWFDINGGGSGQITETPVSTTRYCHGSDRGWQQGVEQQRGRWISPWKPEDHRVNPCFIKPSFCACFWFMTLDRLFILPQRSLLICLTASKPFWSKAISFWSIVPCLPCNGQIWFHLLLSKADKTNTFQQHYILRNVEVK